MKNNPHTNRNDFANTFNKVKNGEHVDSQNLDDFDNDAIQGWSESGLSLSAMNTTDKRMNFLTGKSVSWIYYAAMSIVVTGIIIGTVIMTTEPNNPQKAQLSIEQTDLSTPEKFDTLIALKKTDQLTAADVKQKHAQEERGDLPENVEPLSPSINFDKISPEILEPLPATIETGVVEIDKQKSAKEIYMHHLKAIDYTQYRTKAEISIEQVILTGLPANFESEEDIQAESTTKIVQIPYVDYLEKTMGFVEKGRWKQALTRFEEILKTYPDDVNAMFYSGMCYYNLQQYQQACSAFSASLQLDFSNFNEEATWYLAKSRLANNDKTLAKELFTAIRDNKGYYAKQAEKILKDWK